MSQRYSVERKLGAGGSGTVYLGWRLGPEGFRRRVAIKRPHADLISDPAGRRATLREAALASRLHHAHVVAVVDVLVEDDDISLVLEYVDGASLAELLDASLAGRTPPLPPRVALRVVLDACAGLAAMHEHADEAGPHALLHQDVSPQNVLVGRDGVARVSDLGLARAAEATATRSTGSIVGKLGYLAPEVLDGAPFSERADLYALGVVAWEALARRRLLSSGTSEIEIRRAVRSAIPRLSSVVPGVSPALERAVASALERDPGRRPVSVRAFAAALEDAARAADWVGTHLEVGAWVERAAGKLQPSAVHTPTMQPAQGSRAAGQVTAALSPWTADDEPTPIVDEITGLAEVPAAGPASVDPSDEVGRTTVKLDTPAVVRALPPREAPALAATTVTLPVGPHVAPTAPAVPAAWPAAAEARVSTRRRAVGLVAAASLAASVLLYAAISSREAPARGGLGGAPAASGAASPGPVESPVTSAPREPAPSASQSVPPPSSPAATSEALALDDDIEVLAPLTSAEAGGGQRAAVRQRPRIAASSTPSAAAPPTPTTPLPPDNPYRKRSPGTSP